jgi:hypothetical protein
MNNIDINDYFSKKIFDIFEISYDDSTHEEITEVLRSYATAYALSFKNNSLELEYFMKKEKVREMIQSGLFDDFDFLSKRCREKLNDK